MMLQQGLRFAHIDRLAIRLNMHGTEVVLDIEDERNAVCIVLEMNDQTRPLMLALAKQVEKVIRIMEK